MTDSIEPAPMNREYWDGIADLYQQETRISTHDVHYGPLLPGEADLKFLPELPDGAKIIELGSGAGQNAIALARKGYACHALDVSPEQLAHGRALADEADVPVFFVEADMLHPPSDLAGTFDLVLSAYALPFADNPEEWFAAAARLLKPGGQLLVSTGHPLFSASWMEFDDGETGLWVENYFQPATDMRTLDTGSVTRARNWPVSRIVQAMLDAGFTLDRIAEPEPLPWPTISAEDREIMCPYWSDAWADLFDECSKVPVVLVLRGRKG